MYLDILFYFIRALASIFGPKVALLFTIRSFRESLHAH
jgi:hypothetical protein